MPAKPARPLPAGTRRALAALLLAGALAAPAAGQFDFTRVADFATPVPGQGGTTFGTLADDPGESPSAFGQRVQFWGGVGDGFDELKGLFLFSGGVLSGVADDSQERPGNPGVPYGGINPRASLADGASAFVVDGNPEDGVYRVSGATHSLVADESTLVPPALTVAFSDLSPPSASGTQVAFFGQFESGSGLYLFDGLALTRIVDSSMEPPGSDDDYQRFLAWPSLDGGQIAFVAQRTDFGTGLYFWNGSDVQIVADDSTADPRGVAGTFGFFDDTAAPSLDGGRIAFRARLVIPTGESSFDHVEGVFLWDGASLVTLAQAGDPRPGGGNFTFELEDWVSISQGRVLFTSDGGDALWLWDGGVFTRVLAVGEQLDGSTVDDIFIGPEALSGGCMAFTVIEAENSEPLVYRACEQIIPPSMAEIPTLGEWGALLLVTTLGGIAFLTLRRLT